MARLPDELGEEITRQLADRQYDHRKQGALELEQKVRTALYAQDNDQVRRILDSLHVNFIDSQQPAYKKGGLIGLASVAIALEDQISNFLRDLVKPVLGLFKDEEARVRYYACEALYNICKVAGGAILDYFNDIFDGLCTLYADVDGDVKNGVSYLDRCMKDIVEKGGSTFQVESFVQLLKSRMHHRNPFIRQLLLAWIRLLLKQPEMDMVAHLPEYLEGLFNMLGDQSKDVRHNADACLKELLQGVLKCNKDTSKRKDETMQVVADTASIVVKFCTAERAESRLIALMWLHDFVQLQIQLAPQGSPCEKWVLMLPDLLDGTLHCIDNEEEEITRMAVEMNNNLLEMSSSEPLRRALPVERLVERLLLSMSKKGGMDGGSKVVRTACLQWICMLLVQSSEQMLRRPTLHQLFEPVFETLLHTDDEVVCAALGVLAQIMQGRCEDEEDRKDADNQDLFTVVADKLLHFFNTKSAATVKREGSLLETKGRLMIRHLCGQLDARRLYVTLARMLQHETSDVASLEFARQLVQTLSWILFTATETKCLREELVRTAPLAEVEEAAPEGGPAGSRSLFLELLVPWFHNPVSALALCLWAQQYELATELTARFATFEPTLDLLRQLDQLVHLLESPVFSRLRLRLLEPRQHPALLKCLLGLAMLLPQAGAFTILRERIHVMQSGLLLECGTIAGSDAPRAAAPASQSRMLAWMVPGKASASATNAPTSEIDLDGLLKRFDEVTARAQA